MSERRVISAVDDALRHLEGVLQREIDSDRARRWDLIAQEARRAKDDITAAIKRAWPSERQ